MLLLGVGGLRWGEAAALRMIHAGANPKVVQRMPGYASAVMTLDVQRFVRSDLDHVAESVANQGGRRPPTPVPPVGLEPTLDGF